MAEVSRSSRKELPAVRPEDTEFPGGGDFEAVVDAAARDGIGGLEGEPCLDRVAVGPGEAVAAPFEVCGSCRVDVGIGEREGSGAQVEGEEGGVGARVGIEREPEKIAGGGSDDRQGRDGEGGSQEVEIIVGDAAEAGVTAVSTECDNALDNGVLADGEGGTPDLRLGVGGRRRWPGRPRPRGKG